MCDGYVYILIDVLTQSLSRDTLRQITQTYSRHEHTHTLTKNPLWALNKAWFSPLYPDSNLFKPIIKVKGCLFVFRARPHPVLMLAHGEGIVAHKRKLECRSHHHTFILPPTMRENPPGCSLVSPQAPPPTSLPPSTLSARHVIAGLHKWLHFESILRIVFYENCHCY